ncbi:hypothetical protein DSO57_1020816 [Entomophthora muscae]|uniref:Uncharacterized protein n=1 Tax=Entomophthora muscae TaxID=34485 RepID=A0ACC2U1Z8_9FUNG|nr:hypothetical protein DSO57_1020816 [Entomophthora muscae]
MSTPNRDEAGSPAYTSNPAIILDDSTFPNLARSQSDLGNATASSPSGGSLSHLKDYTLSTSSPGSPSPKSLKRSQQTNPITSSSLQTANIATHIKANSPPGSKQQENSQNFSDDIEYADHGHCHSFYQQLSIHVDQPVVAMSISPSKRDIVLASRQGLFIVDLESPFDPPRTLPYFSKWEVSEVQWNPHPSRDTWIATTCSSKLLVWNLLQPKLNSVEFTLSGHGRAISDICWSNHHPEILGSASLDTSVKIWDLRVNPRSSVHTLMSWNMAVAQVDFHHHNEHLLATGQESELRIWDVRKGSHAVHIVPAHDRKIANIKWNHTCSNEILTCSYDKTIKFWDVEDLSSYKSIIETKLPVGRARYTPFGRGVVSFPLRNENDLYLWDKDNPAKPVFRYQGHTDIVKDFVWRIHGNKDSSGQSDEREFQLITFSLDRQLRLWPASEAQMKAVGHQPNRAPSNDGKAVTASSFSYRTPRHSTISIPSPIAQLHPTWSLRRKSTFGDIMGGTSPPAENTLLSASPRSILPLVPQRPHRTYDFMATDAASGWMRLGEPSGAAEWIVRSLAEEFSMVSQLFKRVKFEKVNVSGRTCTITLHGPWAKDGGPAFLRIGMRFPEDYPNQAPPQFELHKSGMMSMANRAGIVDSLHRIAQSYVAKGTHCLQACISYLLGEKPPLDADSDLSDEETRLRRRLPGARDGSGLERDDHNIPFPRMCGGVFGSNGQLVLYFSSLNASPMADGAPSMRGLLRSSYYQTHPRSYESLEIFRTMTRLPPRIITRPSDRPSPTSEDPDDLDDLLTIPSLFYRPNSHHLAQPPAAIFTAAAEDLQPPTDSLKGNIVCIKSVPGIAPADIGLAQAYRAYGGTLAQAIAYNRAAAKARGRKDLTRMWKTLILILLIVAPGNKHQVPYISMRWGSHPLGSQLLCSILSHFEARGDFQTLAMLACILDLVNTSPSSPTVSPPARISLDCESPKDYFSSSFFHKPKSNTLPITAFPKPTATPSPLPFSRHRATSSRTSEVHLFDYTGALSVQDTGEFSEDAFEGPGSLSTAASVKSDFVASTPHAGLLTQEYASKLVHYRLLYADTLYRWGMLVQRAELMKNLVHDPHVHQGLDFRPTCHRCFSHLQTYSRDAFQYPLNANSSKEGWICLRCDRPRQFPKCCICSLAVKGISSFCIKCGHGGHFDHMQEWFQDFKYTECPTGCGCTCVTNQNGTVKR